MIMHLCVPLCQCVQPVSVFSMQPGRLQGVTTRAALMRSVNCAILNVQ